MMVNFDFLSEPIHITGENISVLYIENTKLFRNIFNSFLNNEIEEANVVFSENFIPIKPKGVVFVIEDFFRLSFSAAIIKKLYEQIEKYCNYEMQKETIDLKTHVVSYMEQIINSFDYDFEFDYDVRLTDLFKVSNLKPVADQKDVLNTLLDYILILNKYALQKCFVLMNLHLYFTEEEIDAFYRDIRNNHINLLVIENKKIYKTSIYEKVVVYDNDFCEIVEN